MIHTYFIKKKSLLILQRLLGKLEDILQRKKLEYATARATLD